jgi:hypothetical protein
MEDLAVGNEVPLHGGKWTRAPKLHPEIATPRLSCSSRNHFANPSSTSDRLSAIHEWYIILLDHSDGPNDRKIKCIRICA